MKLQVNNITVLVVVVVRGAPTIEQEIERVVAAARAKLKGGPPPYVDRIRLN